MKRRARPPKLLELEEQFLEESTVIDKLVILRCYCTGETPLAAKEISPRPKCDVQSDAKYQRHLHSTSTDVKLIAALSRDLRTHENITLLVGLSCVVPSSQNTAGRASRIKKKGRRGKKNPNRTPCSIVLEFELDDIEEFPPSMESIQRSSRARACSSTVALIFG